MMTDKRKKVEELIDKTLSLMDPSGINAKKYRNMFQTMNDKQFENEKAAKYLNIKLFENVYIPHVSSNPNRPVRTKQPVLVGYLNIKRPQQLVTKKTGLAITDTNRDEQTGAAKGDSKGGTTTGIENELLAGVGGDVILSEFCGARGDNVAEYDNMIQSIAEHGSVKLADIKTNAYDKPTLMQADLYFKAMGLKTDLISESYYSIEAVRTAMKQKS